MGFKKTDVKRFRWSGNDKMINLSSSSRVPKKVPRAFRAMLILKNKEEVRARVKWRKLIWTLWYKNQKSEIISERLLQVSDQLLGRT